VSIGVASLSVEDRSVNDLLLRADKGLYKAKGEGRNNVSWVTQDH
jgi:PleD family two-component response regulator